MFFEGTKLTVLSPQVRRSFYFRLLFRFVHIEYELAHNTRQTYIWVSLPGAALPAYALPSVSLNVARALILGEIFSLVVVPLVPVVYGLYRPLRRHFDHGSKDRD